tara:strand:- start:249 stop:785 length:537 start_codon:yes stop_codon:yes gene_type:complete
MSEIDFGFIKELEGFKLTGYVPKEKGKELGTSGVTIASGFDLGAHNINDLAGLPEDLIQKFSPYLGLQGKEASNKASSLKITKEEADVVNAYAANRSVLRLKDRYENTTGESFDSLTPRQQTVMASVNFQYGTLETKTPNFWKQVTTGDWDGAERNLRDFGDKYSSRRNKEADYLTDT